MSAPPRKKLKQATIFEGFKKQQSIPKEASSQKQEKNTEITAIDLTEDSQDMEKEKPVDIQTMEKEKEKAVGREEKMEKEKAAVEKTEPTQREKAAEAAERRMKGTSSPPLICSTEEEAAAGSSGHSSSGTSKGYDKKYSPAEPPTCSGDSATEPDSQASQADGSMELFSDYSERQDDHDIPSTPFTKGTPLEELNSHPICSLPLPDLKPSRLHTVLVHTAEGKIKPGKMPQPFPDQFRDKWDKDYVRMPCSHENLYPNGRKTEKRWALITKALKAPMKDFWDLRDAILKYNARYSESWNFDSLHQYFVQEVTDMEHVHFFKQVLPKMAELALDLPRICTAPIPLLQKGNPYKLTLSQKQVACLLANAFFCTFPRRNTRKRNGEYSNYPDINFNALFMNAYDRQEQKMEKIKCILNYFRRVTKEMPTGLLTFKRQLIHDFPKWESSQATLTRLHVTSTGTIEDEGAGMLQVDFANKCIGGGVLGRGCVQEEIRFLICPELIVSRLFTEVLEDNECLIMTGAERFSTYTGYAQSFKFAGSYDDPTPSDMWCRRYTEVVAIDAMSYRQENQFGRFYVHRELEKAYCGFSYIPESPVSDEDRKREHSSAVATGNWGCGAFGGDVKLKSLLQWIAAAEAGRDVCYFTFNDSKLAEELYNMHQYIYDRRITVSDLMGLIQDYYTKYKHSCNKPDIFSFIWRVKDEDSNPDIDENSREWMENSQEMYANTP